MTYNTTGRRIRTENLADPATVTLSYDAMGRQTRAVDAAGVTTLAYPNGLTDSWTYGSRGELLEVDNALPGGTVLKYAYTCDAAGRRIACAKSGSAFTTSDSYAYLYNARSELTNATASVDAAYRYGYEFDDIGNREASSERGTNSVYTANGLNQYTSVDDFVPQFDDDGNQTLVKTATGIWQVAYNGENRPVHWERIDQSAIRTILAMSYDRMGRRVTKNDQRFVYNDFLQVADNAGNVYVWDPTELVATRPLFWIHDGETFFYTHDGNESVGEVMACDGTLAAHYEYAPFGALIVSRDEEKNLDSSMPILNRVLPIPHLNSWRFSSEFADDETEAVCYNYRYSEPVTGRWMSRDPLGEYNLYVFADNGMESDWLGLIKFSRNCREIEGYCRSDLEGILAALEKISLNYKPSAFRKGNHESKAAERRRRDKWRLERGQDPLWGGILEIYKRRGLLRDGIHPVEGIWNNPQRVRDELKQMVRDIKDKVEPEVVCCPKDPTGALCGKKSTSGGYLQPEAVGTFDRRYVNKIIVCPAMMGESNMIARNGGCGCFLMHELMHRNGMKIPGRDKTKDREKYELPIENAMIEIQRLILRELSDRVCKGYDVD